MTKTPRFQTTPKAVHLLSKGDRILFDDGTDTFVLDEHQRRGNIVHLVLGDLAQIGSSYAYDALDVVQVIHTETISEEEFNKRFTLVEISPGDFTTDDFATMKRHKENHVWSLVDDGDGGMALCAGFAMVNFIAWQVTEEPHPGENGSIVVEMPNEYPEECMTCHQRMRKDETGVWIDETEGDVCMNNDGEDGPHELDEPIWAYYRFEVDDNGVPCVDEIDSDPWGAAEDAVEDTVVGLATSYPGVIYFAVEKKDVN